MFKRTYFAFDSSDGEQEEGRESSVSREAEPFISFRDSADSCGESELQGGTHPSSLSIQYEKLILHRC
jgi:hypothetical protein